MDYVLLTEQVLNGFQLGIILFLMAAGLTLVFGIMDLVNLAHGSMFMIGAFVGGTFALLTGSFVLGVILMVPAMLEGEVLVLVAAAVPILLEIAGRYKSTIANETDVLACPCLHLSGII